MSHCLADAASYPEAMKAALRAICEAESWDCADFWRRDEPSATLRRFGHWSAPGVAPALRLVAQAPNGAFEAGVELADWISQSGEPLWIADALHEPQALSALQFEHTGLRAVLLYPVHHARRVVGVLQLACRAVRAPEKRFLDSINSICKQIGQMLEREAAAKAKHESEARVRSLSDLSSDWYWEQDASYAFTRLEGRHVAGGDQALARRLIGIRRWESGLEVEGGWDAHRALLDERKPFHEVLMWRAMPDGRVRYLSVSGEPVFDAEGGFLGYRGIGRDVTAQKRAEQMLKLEHEVARSLAAAEDAASGLKAVIRAMCEVEGWDAGRYFRVDEASGALRFQDGWCVNAPAVDHFVERSRMVWQTGKAIWSADIRGNKGAEGAFAFAVLSEGKTIGVLAFSGRMVRPPEERLEQAARVIGSQVGQFLSRKHAEESLRESEARFRSLTQMSSDFFWETDGEHRFTSLVHGPHYAATQIGGDLIAKTLWEMPSVSPNEAGWASYKATLESRVPFRDFEFARATPDGVTRHFSLSGEPRVARDGTFLGYRGVGRDITESVLSRERIASLAYSDPLTGLANRTSLGPALEQAVERSRRRGSKLAGVFIDLDGFKQVNDLYGHDAGDRFLIEVARRLRASVRASDVVARLGGDEFFVLLEEVQDEAAVENVVRKLLGEAVRPYDVAGGGEVRVSASIGVSLFPDNAADAAALIKHADTAMYAAKQAGKNGYCFFSSLNSGDASLNAIARAVEVLAELSPSPEAPSSQEAE